MRTPLVLVDASLADRVAGDRVPLSGDDEHHLRRVLRRGDGDEVEVTDGAGGRARARLAAGGVVLDAAPVVTPAPVPAVRVLHAVPKGRGLDEVVRTCTELGVAELVPVVTARCVSRPSGDRAASAVERWRAVADAALGQARRSHRMVVGPVTPLDRAMTDVVTSGGFSLVAHPDAPRGLGTTLRVISTERDIRSITVAVGPEGGLTSEEVQTMEEHGFTAVHLGPTVLRSVHAATVVVAAVNALSGRYDTT